MNTDILKIEKVSEMIESLRVIDNVKIFGLLICKGEANRKNKKRGKREKINKCGRGVWTQEREGGVNRSEES